MSRISTIEQLYSKKKSALEFNYESLSAPPIMALFTQQDIAELTRIATSIKYNANIDLKYELIDAVMVSRGFRKAHAGTNRVVYNFLEDPSFVAKVAIDKVGMNDTPAEFKNQELIKPFCCKIFEVTPNGVLGFVERVNPVSSIEEFLSIADDIFNLMITKIIGKYVVADLSAKKFMNFGVRTNAQGHTFGPVVIDFPYVYELDDKKLVCNNIITNQYGSISCGGEIDYTDDLDMLMCTKCHKTYKARDLAKKDSGLKLLLQNCEGDLDMASRVRIMSGNKVVMDTGRSSKTYVTKDQCRPFNNGFDNVDQVDVAKSIYRKPKTKKQIKNKIYNEIAVDYYNKMQRSQYVNDEEESVTVDGSGYNIDSDIKSNHINYDNIDEYEVYDEDHLYMEGVIKDTELVNDDEDQEATDNEESEVGGLCEEDEVVEEDQTVTDELVSDNLFGIDVASIINSMNNTNEEEPDYSNYNTDEVSEEEPYDDDDDNINSFNEYNIKKEKKYAKKNNPNMDAY